MMRGDELISCSQDSKIKVWDAAADWACVQIPWGGGSHQMVISGSRGKWGPSGGRSGGFERAVRAALRCGDVGRFTIPRAGARWRPYSQLHWAK